MIARILAAVMINLATRSLSRGMDVNHIHFYGLVGGMISMAILLLRPDSEGNDGCGE